MLGKFDNDLNQGPKPIDDGECNARGIIPLYGRTSQVGEIS